MNMRTRWVTVSIGGGILMAAVLLVFPRLLFFSLPSPFDFVADAVCWPVFICEHLVGPRPALGPAGKHLHERTPVHMVAAAIGIAFSWMFWSSLVLLLIRIRLYGSRPLPHTRTR